MLSLLTITIFYPFFCNFATVGVDRAGNEYWFIFSLWDIALQNHMMKGWGQKKVFQLPMLFTLLISKQTGIESATSATMSFQQLRLLQNQRWIMPLVWQILTVVAWTTMLCFLNCTDAEMWGFLRLSIFCIWRIASTLRFRSRCSSCPLIIVAI